MLLSDSWVARMAFRPAGVTREVAPRLAAALFRGVAHARLQAALGLEAVEPGVQGASRHRPAGAFFDQLTDGDRVGVRVEVQDGQQDGVLEFSEVDGCHVCNAGYINAYIAVNTVGIGSKVPPKPELTA